MIIEYIYICVCVYKGFVTIHSSWTCQPGKSGTAAWISRTFLLREQLKRSQDGKGCFGRAMGWSLEFHLAWGGVN